MYVLVTYNVEKPYMALSIKATYRVPKTGVP